VFHGIIGVAYGSKGHDPVIPPDATLRFVIELLGFEPDGLSSPGRITLAEKKKAEGNAFYKVGMETGDMAQVETAIAAYERVS
jgi:hypothetical protein